MNVGILLVGMAGLDGAGGAERFYADLFDVYNSQSTPKRKLFFISDDLKPLKELGRLTSFPEKQLLFKSYRHSFFYSFTKNRPRIDHRMNFIRAFFTRSSLMRQLRKHNIKAIQMPVYVDLDFYLIKLLDNLSLNKRPKLILNLTNATVQNHYFDSNPSFAYHSKLNYGRLFENIKLDAVLTWYKAFKEFALKEKIIRSNPPIYCVNTRFTSTAFFEDFSDRDNKVIFSGRFSQYKDPLFFIKAVELVYKQMPNHGWKFEMYGKGPLEGEAREYIAEHHLENLILLSHTPDVPSILKRSKIYVSTQNVENFPSLAMAEAMACCNLIIARNVGQTDYYVKDNVNGYILKQDTPENLAEILIKIIKDPSQIEKMGKESIKLLKEVHNPQNFIKEIDEFWDSIK